MDSELYKKYLSMKLSYKAYVTLYNYLVDIANAPFQTWTCPFKRKYEVTEARFTVDKALQALRSLQSIIDQINQIDKKEINENISNIQLNKKINEFGSKFNEQKFKKMLQVIREIRSAKKHKLQTDIFDAEYVYYKNETIDRANNCLNTIKQFI